MKRLIAVMVAMAAITFLGQADVNAQDFLGGYRFGAGVGANFGGGFARGFQREQPPYFAKFPPVYYSHIVKRPYGISPYAAPAGIAPVEMNYQVPVVPSVTKVNPFFKPEINRASEAKNQEKKEDKVKDKMTWSNNPHFSTIPTSVVVK